MSKINGQCAIALAVGGLVVPMFAATARGGAVALTRSSLIQTQGQIVNEDLAGSESTDQFGTFNKSIVKSGGDPAATHGDLNVSQNTTVNQSNGKITGSGSLAAHAFGQFSNPNDVSGPLAIQAQNNLTVTFEVTGAGEPFTAHGEFGSLNILGADAHFMLQQTSAPSGGGQPLQVIFQNDEFSPTTFDDSRTLEAGMYKIVVDAGAGSSGSSRGDQFSSGEDTSLNFNFSAGTASSAIPLPASVWTGAVGLISVVALIAPRSRKRVGLLFS
jgi:adhesin HecA-like repeat protein